MYINTYIMFRNTYLKKSKKQKQRCIIGFQKFVFETNLWLGGSGHVTGSWIRSYKSRYNFLFFWEKKTGLWSFLLKLGSQVCKWEFSVQDCWILTSNNVRHQETWTVESSVQLGFVKSGTEVTAIQFCPQVAGQCPERCKFGICLCLELVRINPKYFVTGIQKAPSHI